MTGLSSTEKQTYVLLGSVIRPHGIKGELKIRPFTEQPANFTRYRRLLLAADARAEKKVYTSEQARVSGALVILRLLECSSRDMAESLVGQGVWLPIEELPPPQEGEFYLHSLLGKAVQTVDGRLLGRAEGILAGSRQNILVVRQGDQEHLIPVVRAFIHFIDADAVTLDVPDGLLDINR